MSTTPNKTEPAQINADGRAFNGNYVAVGIAFALVGVGALVALWKLVILPIVGLF